MHASRASCPVVARARKGRFFGDVGLASDAINDVRRQADRYKGAETRGRFKTRREASLVDAKQASRVGEGHNAAFGAMHLAPALAPEGMIAIVLMFSSLLGFALTTKRLFVTLYAGPPLIAEIVPIAAILGVQTMFNYANYVYDFPTLLFSSLGLLLLARERWWLFVATYAVGLLNKETTVLLAPLFLFHYFARVPFRTYVSVGVATCVTFIASRVLLNQLYSSNLGVYTIFQLVAHNVGLLHSYPPASLLTTGLVFVFVFGHWSRKPALMRDASLMSLPLLGACALYGFFDELRDYYEVYPVLVMLVTPTIASVMGVEVTACAEPRPRMQTRAWIRGQIGIATV